MITDDEKSEEEEPDSAVDATPAPKTPVSVACDLTGVEALNVSPDTDERSDDVFLDDWASREELKKTRRQLRETRAALNRLAQVHSKEINNLKMLARYAQKANGVSRDAINMSSWRYRRSFKDMTIA